MVKSWSDEVMDDGKGGMKPEPGAPDGKQKIELTQDAYDKLLREAGSAEFYKRRDSQLNSDNAALRARAGPNGQAAPAQSEADKAEAAARAELANLPDEEAVEQAMLKAMGYPQLLEAAGLPELKVSPINFIRAITPYLDARYRTMIRDVVLTATIDLKQSVESQGHQMDEIIERFKGRLLVTPERVQAVLTAYVNPDYANLPPRYLQAIQAEVSRMLQTVNTKDLNTTQLTRLISTTAHRLLPPPNQLGERGAPPGAPVRLGPGMDRPLPAQPAYLEPPPSAPGPGNAWDRLE